MKNEIIRIATIEDVKQYKRGKKDVDPSKYYLCQCECGNYWVPSIHNYKTGRSTSCGRHSNDMRFIDETGKQYGELKVLYPAKEKTRQDGHKFWICQCSCGNIITVCGKDLRQNKQNSCGCVKSKGQKLITKLLSENLIDFKTEHKFSDCLNVNNNPYRFDWAIFKNNKLYCILEYDGEQHTDTSNAWYRGTIDDDIKTNYCIKNNIAIYRISYLEYPKLTIQYLKEKIHYD